MLEFNVKNNEEIIQLLKEAVPHGEVFADTASIKAHKNDPRGMNMADGDELAYVEVEDTEDIQGVLRIARQFHIPIVPQTTATSTVSGSDAVAGSIILSVKRMNQIIEVDPRDQVAVVQPGVINQDLDTAARKVGMFYAPDPGSKPISAIGGNASTNAGGMSTVKYGATRDAVLGLKVILADGRELKLGGRTFKQAFGYDLTHLFVGSEGTLGIITEVTVKLEPIPLGDPLVGLAFFKDLETLVQAVGDIRISGVYPTMLEALDARSTETIDRYLGTHYAQKDETMLIFKLDVADDRSIKAIEDILKRYEANNIQLTSDEEKMAQIIKLRQSMLPAIYQGQNHVMEDMAVPMSKMATLMNYIEQVGKDLNLSIYIAGHAGDGNVHPTFVWPESQPDMPESINEALRLIFEKTLELGGTISGEHAVGMLKNKWTYEELGAETDLLQHQIKSLLDPMGLLNPHRKIN